MAPANPPASTSACSSGCTADVDLSGTVDFGDVAFLLLLFS